MSTHSIYDQGFYIHQELIEFSCSKNRNLLKKTILRLSNITFYTPNNNMARENLLKFRRGNAQECAAVNPTLDLVETNQ